MKKLIVTLTALAVSLGAPVAAEAKPLNEQQSHFDVGTPRLPFGFPFGDVGKAPKLTASEVAKAKEAKAEKNPVFADGVLPSGAPLPGRGEGRKNDLVTGTPGYAPLSTSGNGSCASGYGYSGRYGVVNTDKLSQSVTVLGGAYTLDYNAEHRNTLFVLDVDPHLGSQVQLGLWKGNGPPPLATPPQPFSEFFDTTAHDRVSIYVEWQEQGDETDNHDETYRWFKVGEVSVWSAVTLRIERHSVAQPNLVRALVNGVDKTGWLVMEYAPIISKAFDEASNVAGTNCDNAYHAFYDLYWGLPYVFGPYQGMAFGHISQWNFRGTLKNAAQPYCGTTAPDGITWYCN